MPIAVRRTLLALPVSLLAGGLAPTASSARVRHHEAGAGEPPAGQTTDSGSTAQPVQAPPPPAPPPPAPLTRAERRQRSGACDVSLEASSALVRAGEAVSLHGRLACGGGVGESGEELAVLQHERGSGATGMSELGTVSTGEDGSFTLTSGPLVHRTAFVVRSLVARNVHARIVVLVVPRLTLKGPAPSGSELATRSARAAGHNRVTFSGTVSPAPPAGTRVALQRQYLASGEGWHTVAFGRLDSEGHYSISHAFRAPGQVNIRVLVRPAGELASATPVLTYDISQAQNPQLTIQSSADPVSPGAPVTIAGVAAGPAGQTVTLLGRTHGQAFTAAASARTEAGGVYSFTVTPRQNTTYRVLGPGMRSTALFEGVRDALAVDAPASTIAAGTPVTFAGSVAPALPGQTIHLERRERSGTGFKVVGSATVAGDGSFSLAYSFRAAASEVVRLRVPAGAQTLGGTSPEFTIAVTGATAARAG